MHIEVLVEDKSGAQLLGLLLPKLLGALAEPPTWRLHPYCGIGRLPKGLGKAGDPSHRILLDQLPRLLRGYGKTPGVDAVLVVLDTDKRDCKTFLSELMGVAARVEDAPRTLFRLAIEEVEAWYLGDRAALYAAYPKARRDVLQPYVQDSACDTWELLADSIHPGGSAAIKNAGWPLPGQVKHEWARRIGPLMDPSQNRSPSFCKFRDGVARLVSSDGE